METVGGGGEAIGGGGEAIGGGGETIGGGGETIGGGGETIGGGCKWSCRTILPVSETIFILGIIVQTFLAKKGGSKNACAYSVQAIIVI